MTKPVSEMTPEETHSFVVKNESSFSLSMPQPSLLIMFSPRVIDADGTVYRPFVEIFWNHETKQIDVRHSGDISDAAKLFFDVLGERLWNMFKDRL